MGNLLGTVFGSIWTLMVRSWRWADGHIRRELQPVHRFGGPDQIIEQWSAVRGILGLILVTAAQVMFAGVAFDLNQQTNLWAGSLVTAVVTTGCVLLVTAAVLIRLSPPAHRRVTAANLWVPIRVVLLAVTASVAAGLVMTGMIAIGGNGWGALLTIPFLIIGLPVLACGFITGGRLLIQHYFRAVDGHPTLRALVAVGVSAVTAVLGIISLFDADPMRMPMAIRIMLAVVGPVVVVGLSIWELRRLQTFGITPRWVPTAA